MAKNAILIHGYGVRGFFWSALAAELTEDFGEILTPDLQMATVEEGVAQVVDLARENREITGEPVALIGHSLGGVIAALGARRLTAEEASHLIVIASPYGNVHSGGIGKLLRLAVRYRLIPAWVVRPRFFGPEVPRATQKALFSQAVTESEELRDLSRQDRWFHTGAFPEPPVQRTLVVASAADRIVNAAETLAFGGELGGETVLLPESEGIGHNDFGYWPPAARRVAAEIREFLYG